MEPSLKLLTDNGYIAPKEPTGNASKGRSSQKIVANLSFLQKRAGKIMRK